ncbi:Glutaredoxin 3 [Seminavis robusta]|uniref:Glutaredoxin 3 n=1 Tax=Seminavis robusta TaxID=568900 RepID=A0A9N8H9S4_9STRA|nr:Glutaredoxin 3 [Seminavis robusta]|eukprot:Sro125_g060110.1 Glutaredoxin 3 (339) ;mRNA; f:19942-20958
MSTQQVLDLTSAPPSGKKAVLLFWAPWHEASVEDGTMGQVLKALASSSASDSSIIFGRVEAEQVQELTDKYGVTAVPTFVLLDAGGGVMARLEGDEDVAGVTQAVQNLIQAAAPTTSAVETSKPGPTPEERLTQRLDKLIRSSGVMVFMKGEPKAPRCGFSRQIVGLLEEEKIPFGSFDILSDEDVRQGLKKHSNWPTYPQLYVNGDLVGGLDIVKEMKEDGALREQLGISEHDIATTSLDERLGQLVRRHKIMLFMKGLPSAPRCGFSRQIVELLNDMGVSYDTFNILEDEEVRQGLKKYSDWPTYPQLYVNGDLVGGLDIVKELVESGEMDSMLDG